MPFKDIEHRREYQRQRLQRIKDSNQLMKGDVENTIQSYQHIEDKLYALSNCLTTITLEYKKNKDKAIKVLNQNKELKAELKQLKDGST